MERKQKKILGGAAAALCVCYLAGAAFFAGHTYPNSTVDGKDASLISYTRAQELITAAATEGSLGIRVKDLSYSLHRKDVLGVESRDNWKAALKDGSSFAWPVAIFQRQELLSKRTVDVHRDAVEKLLEEQGLFEVSIPAQDAKLSDYTADAGYSVLPAETGWSASKEDILNAVVEALQSDQSELDLTDTFAVQPAVTADNATLAEKAAARNALVNHVQLDSETLNSWLRETRDGTTGLDYAALEDYVNGLQGQFEPQLAALSAEHGGENYVVDSERMMQILCAKLGINRPVRESEAQKAARLAANAKKLKAAKRAARREKDKATAEQLLKEAEAQQTQAPEYIATLKSEEDRAADAASPVLTASLRDGIFIENPDPDPAPAQAAAGAEATAAESQTAAGTVQTESVNGDTIAVGAAPVETETVESLTAEGNSGEASESGSAVKETPKSLNGEIVMAKDDLFVPVLAADPEFQLGHGLNYIDISIEKQRVILFENGRKVMESACVTGLPTRERATHYGNFRIAYKQRNRILRGSQNLYAAFVSYWMPFDGGIGLHDASWRGKFGGNIYQSNGSHGCINLPSAFAKQLYERITVGMPVYVH